MSDQDGVIDCAWRHLTDVVQAAYAQDAARFRKAAAANTKFPLQDQRAVGLYAYHALRYLSAVMVGRRPSSEDLDRLAQFAYPRFSSLGLRAELSHLTRTLKGVYNLVPVQNRVPPGQFIILAPAALGALLRDPERQLPWLRRMVSQWCLSHRAEVTEMLEDG
ncbi:MAG TPA: hypothetical protein VG650_01920 [Mycobacteriales bacterium]|nr:hypothetical protein [Mycobacteriales bacterium]